MAKRVPLFAISKPIIPACDTQCRSVPRSWFAIWFAIRGLKPLRKKGADLSRRPYLLPPRRGSGLKPAPFRHTQADAPAGASSAVGITPETRRSVNADEGPNA